jgi:NitT/TauT family transport system substrate-binding protein
MARLTPGLCLPLALAALVASFFSLARLAPLAAQIHSNFASSVTGESMAAVWVARERGFFKKHGLETQFIVMSRSPLAVAALIAGEIDAAIIGPGHLLNASSSGADLVGVANFFQKLDHSLNGRPELKRAEDLRGKRLAISGPGASSHIVALLALQKLGIDPNAAKIGFITIPGTELNRRLALESGSVDATTLRGAVGDLYASKGYTALYNFKGSDVIMSQTMVVTTRRTIMNKPQLVEGYMKGFVEAIAYILEPANKEPVKRILASNLRLNFADVEESYHSIVNSHERIPYPTAEGMKTLHGIMVTLNPKLASVNPEKVLDASFVRKLESTGFVQNLAHRP